jgi:hypothetical protein
MPLAVTVRPICVRPCGCASTRNICVMRPSV